MQAYVLLIVGMVLLISGGIAAKIWGENGKLKRAAVAAILAFSGFIVAYFGYDTYMMEPTQFSISNVRVLDNGYSFTLKSDLKGFTSGTVVVSKEEAKIMGILIVDEKGNESLTPVLNGSRKWVQDHRYG